jgi:hypothetical protein
MLRGERACRRSRVHYVLEAQAGVTGGISAVDLTHAASSDQCDVDLVQEYTPPENRAAR